jgi:hypothetical protein
MIGRAGAATPVAVAVIAVAAVVSSTHATPPDAAWTSGRLRSVPRATSGRSPMAQATPEAPEFPPGVATTQEKIEWLSARAEAVVHAVEAETEKPAEDQRETVYRRALARATELMRLVETVPAPLPRLKGRLSEAIIKANGGLERIANRGLKIGMTADEVREIRGEPTAITETPTPSGVRQRWEYGTATVLVF